MAFESTISGKSPLTYFKTQLFSLQNSKTTHYEPFLPISTEFHFLIKLFPIGLKHTGFIKPYISNATLQVKMYYV